MSGMYPTNILVSLFQLPVQYDSLKVTQEHRGHTGEEVRGMCHFSKKLYVTERRMEAGSYRYRLAVYHVMNMMNQNTIPPLSTLYLDLQDAYRQPRVDGQSGLVYIPCMSHGVRVVRYDGSQVVPVTTLRCVLGASSLAVVSPNTLYISDKVSKTVCLVDVAQDRIIGRLQEPQEVRGEWPDLIAVLGDTVLVVYGDNDLVIYHHGVSTPGQALLRPPGLLTVSGLTTDDHSNFLLTDSYSDTVYVMDISGKLTHTISIPGDRRPVDCTVVGILLWVGCINGDIVVMSSQ